MGWRSARKARESTKVALAEAGLSLENLMLTGERASRDEWLDWIPRESNKAADGLASLAMARRETSVWTHRHHRRYAAADVVGWTDAGIGTNGEVGLGWMVLERAWPHEVVAMGHVYHGTEEAQDGKDSSREELRALSWAHWHMRQIRIGNKVDDIKPLSAKERKKLQAKMLVALQGSVSLEGRQAP